MTSKTSKKPVHKMSMDEIREVLECAPKIMCAKFEIDTKLTIHFDFYLRDGGLKVSYILGNDRNFYGRRGYLTKIINDPSLLDRFNVAINRIHKWTNGETDALDINLPGDIKSTPN